MGPELTRMGSTSLPSGMAEWFILAMRSRVVSAASVFPVETLNRADSGINWVQMTLCSLHYTVLVSPGGRTYDAYRPHCSKHSVKLVDLEMGL
jgi:hypothetical protein